MLTQETVQLRNSCVWKTPRPRPICPHNIWEFWGQNFYTHSQNLIFLFKDPLRTIFLLTTFYVFLTGHLKKRKKSCFFEIWKKRKIRILEHWFQQTRVCMYFNGSCSHWYKFCTSTDYMWISLVRAVSVQVVFYPTRMKWTAQNLSRAFGLTQSLDSIGWY